MIQNLPNAFDEFEHRVVIYNSLLTRLPKASRREYRITQMDIFVKMKKLLLSKGIVQKINGLRDRSKNTREPRNWKQLKHSMKALHDSGSYMRELVGYNQYSPSSPYKDKQSYGNDPTPTEAGAHINLFGPSNYNNRNRPPRRGRPRRAKDGYQPKGRKPWQDKRNNQNGNDRYNNRRPRGRGRGDGGYNNNQPRGSYDKNQPRGGGNRQNQNYQNNNNGANTTNML